MKSNYKPLSIVESRGTVGSFAFATAIANRLTKETGRYCTTRYHRGYGWCAYFNTSYLQ